MYTVATRAAVVTQAARGDAGGRNSVHRLAKAASRRCSGAFVYTVATRGLRGRPVVTQGDAIVYTDRRKRPFGAVLGHLCTLLRHGGCAGGRVGMQGDAIVYTDRRKRPFDAVSGHLCTLLCCPQRHKQRRELRRMARVPQRHGVTATPPWWPPHPWSRKQVLYVPLPRAFLYSSMNEPNMPLVFPSCLPNALEPLATALETWASTFLATFDPCAFALA